MTRENAIDIAKNFKTPSYVFDLDILKTRLNALQGILGDDVEILYAMKANPFLVPFMKNTDVHFEVCSPGEFAICEKENIDGERIVLSGVNKEPSDMAHVMDEFGGVGIYTVESLRHFQILSSFAAKREKKIDVLLRVTSGNQFGLDEKDIDGIVSKRDKFPYVNIVGLQAYTGTQKKKIEIIEDEIDWLDSIAMHLKEVYGFQVSKIEYGPGLPVSYFEPNVDNENFHMLEQFAKKLDSIRGKYSISLEMGRYLAATCGYFLTRIEDMKVNKDQHFLIVDGGINHINYYGQTMAMKLPVIKHIPMNPEADKCLELSDTEAELTDELVNACFGEQKWNVCGSLCTVGDVLIKNLTLNDAKIGDLLVFENIGAYSVTEGIYLFLSRNLPNIISYSKEEGAKLLRGQLPTHVINSRDCTSFVKKK